jgi:hypothetical protein
LANWRGGFDKAAISNDHHADIDGIEKRASDFRYGLLARLGSEVLECAIEVRRELCQRVGGVPVCFRIRT